MNFQLSNWCSNVDDDVDYFNQIKEEILCEDIKPSLIKKESGNVISYNDYELKPSDEIDSFENIIIKNDKVVILEDIYKTLVSKSPVPLNGNKHFNILEDLHKNKTEFLYSAWTKEKKLKHISSEGSNKANEHEEHREIMSNARNNISKSRYRCDVCQQYFKWIFDLKIHLLSHSRCLCCDLCQRFYMNRNSLNYHLKHHLIGKTHICHVCKASFSQKGNLANHFVIHSGERPHICHVCKASFQLKRHLQQHMLIHTGKRPHICLVCKSSFSQSGHLTNHMLIHTRENPHNCHVCKASFKGKGNLSKHLLIHPEFLYSAWTKKKELKHISSEGSNKANEHEEHREIMSNARNNISQSLYRCDLCQQYFKWIFDLKKHLLSHSRSFSCDLCQRFYIHSSTLNRHLKHHLKHHLICKTHICQVCKASFQLKSHLQRHMLIHTGERPHICHVCKSSFQLKSHLRQHVLIHTGERPHICHVCKSSFQLKSHLRQHVLIHTGERPHICLVCKSSFSQSGHLTNHMLIHTGERPHFCNVCKASFQTKGHLKRHMLIHAGFYHHCADKIDIPKSRLPTQKYNTVRHYFHDEYMNNEIQNIIENNTCPLENPIPIPGLPPPASRSPEAPAARAEEIAHVSMHTPSKPAATSADIALVTMPSTPAASAEGIAHVSMNAPHTQAATAENIADVSVNLPPSTQDIIASSDHQTDVSFVFVDEEDENMKTIRDELMNTIEEVKRERPHICHVCKSSFQLKSHLRQHMLIHSQCF